MALITPSSHIPIHWYDTSKSLTWYILRYLMTLEIHPPLDWIDPHYNLYIQCSYMQCTNHGSKEDRHMIVNVNTVQEDLISLWVPLHAVRL